MIARAAARSALHRTGTAGLGAELGVPASTVRSWLRRLRGRAGQLLQEASSSFGLLVAVAVTREGRDPSPPGPTGSALGDALAAVAACALAAIGWHGYPSAISERWRAGSAWPPPSRLPPEADRQASPGVPVPGSRPRQSRGSAASHRSTLLRWLHVSQRSGPLTLGPDGRYCKAFSQSFGNAETPSIGR